MKLLSVLLISLALATPAQADETYQTALVVPAKVRYGYVFEVAKDTCGNAVNVILKSGRKSSDIYVEGIISKDGLSHDEGNLLYLMCGMYAAGIHDHVDH